MQLYSIGDAAHKAHITIETLRHYDRIGLLKPACVATHSGYRYYSDRELLNLMVIQFCKRHGFSLKEIEEFLSQQDPLYFIDFLQDSEQQIDEEIRYLEEEKGYFRSLRREYELQMQLFDYPEEPCYNLSETPARQIFLSKTLSEPTMENFCLLNEEILSRAVSPSKLVLDPGLRRITWFTPEGENSRLFSFCRNYSTRETEVYDLAPSRYLIRFCKKEEAAEAAHDLLRVARETFHSDPPFFIQSVVFTGISRWDYRLEAPLANRDSDARDLLGEP